MVIILLSSVVENTLTKQKILLIWRIYLFCNFLFWKKGDQKNEMLTYLLSNSSD